MNIEALRAGYTTVFSEGPPLMGYCRCPGRINLLGEHLDYNGLPVLPVTIQHEIWGAFSPRTDHEIVLRNASPTFPERRFSNAPTIPPSATGAWENYCKAAVEALNHYFGEKRYPGMNLYVTSTIPMAAGLSSSSALVVLTALAYLTILGKVLGKDITRLELASLLAEGEHYVGTRGGGMDQAVILTGKRNHACKIDFFPLRVEVVPLLEDAVFVAAHSLVKADKTGNALLRYNVGPLTSRLLTAMVEQAARREFGEEIVIERLGDLWLGPLCLTYEESETLLQCAVTQESYSCDDVIKALALPSSDVLMQYKDLFSEPQKRWNLRARLKHIMTEFRRVEEGRDLLLSQDASAFGELMDASHESCARDYEVSCPELDELVRVARASGALGSRMTGAGFGGYTVSLVYRTAVDSFLEKVYKQYYLPRGLPREKLSEVLWVVEPHDAAAMEQEIA